MAFSRAPHPPVGGQGGGAHWELELWGWWRILGAVPWRGLLGVRCRRPPRQCCCVHCSTRRSCGCDSRDRFRDAVRGLSLWVSGPVAQGGLRLQETGRPGECLVCCLPGGEEDGAAAGLWNVNETRVPTLPCSNESTCEVTAEETCSGFRPSTKIVERRSRASNSHGGGAANVLFGWHTLPRP